MRKRLEKRGILLMLLVLTLTIIQPLLAVAQEVLGSEDLSISTAKTNYTADEALMGIDVTSVNKTGGKANLVVEPSAGVSVSTDDNGNYKVKFENPGLAYKLHTEVAGVGSSQKIEILIGNAVKASPFDNPPIVMSLYKLKKGETNYSKGELLYPNDSQGTSLDSPIVLESGDLENGMTYAFNMTFDKRVAGKTISITLPENITLDESNWQNVGGTTSIASIVKDPSDPRKIKVTFKDEESFGGINEGSYGLEFTADKKEANYQNSVEWDIEGSGKTEIITVVENEKDSIPTKVTDLKKKDADKQNVTFQFDSDGNLQSPKTPPIIKYTLTYNTISANNNFSISDKLPAGWKLIGEFESVVKSRKDQWNYNPETPLGNPQTIDDQGFSFNGLSVEANTEITITYSAQMEQELFNKIVATKGEGLGELVSQYTNISTIAGEEKKKDVTVITNKDNPPAPVLPGQVITKEVAKITIDNQEVTPPIIAPKSDDNGVLETPVYIEYSIDVDMTKYKDIELVGDVIIEDDLFLATGSNFKYFEIVPDSIQLLDSKGNLADPQFTLLDVSGGELIVNATNKYQVIDYASYAKLLFNMGKNKDQKYTIKYKVEVKNKAAIPSTNRVSNAAKVNDQGSSQETDDKKTEVETEWKPQINPKDVVKKFNGNDDPLTFKFVTDANNNVLDKDDGILFNLSDELYGEELLTKVRQAKLSEPVYIDYKILVNHKSFAEAGVADSGNIIISDTLVKGLSLKKDSDSKIVSDFLKVTNETNAVDEGTALKQTGSSITFSEYKGVSEDEFKSDKYRNHYWVQGQVIKFNVGPDESTKTDTDPPKLSSLKKYVISLKCQIDSLEGVSGVTKDGEGVIKVTIANQAEYSTTMYKGKSESVQKDLSQNKLGEEKSDDTVLKKWIVKSRDDTGKANDVIGKGATEEQLVTPGQSTTIDYQIEFNSKTWDKISIIDKNLKIIDTIDTSVFDVEELSDIEYWATYTYSSGEDVKLAVEFVKWELQDYYDEKTGETKKQLVFSLTDAFRESVDAEYKESGKLLLNIKLKTRIFEGKETKEISNSVKATGISENPTYVNDISQSGSSYASELEVKKTVAKALTNEEIENQIIPTFSDNVVASIVGNDLKDRQFIYKVNGLRHNGYTGVGKRSIIMDDLPENIKFIGFLQESNLGAETSLEEISIVKGNATAKYYTTYVDDDQNTHSNCVVIEKPSGKSYTEDFSLYFLVEIQDFKENLPIINKINSSTATIIPSKEYPLLVKKVNIDNKTEEINDANAKFTIEGEGQKIEDVHVWKGQLAAGDSHQTVTVSAPGDYTITEITPPAGYEKTYKSYVITVNKDGSVVFKTNGHVTNPIIYNKKISNAVLQKVDDKGLALKGASFTIYRGYKTKDGIILENAEVGDGTTSGKGTYKWNKDNYEFDPQTDVVTDAGKLVLIGLPDGTYYYEETGTPAGFIPDTKGNLVEVTVRNGVITNVVDSSSEKNASFDNGILKFINKKEGSPTAEGFLPKTGSKLRGTLTAVAVTMLVIGTGGALYLATERKRKGAK